MLDVLVKGIIILGGAAAGFLLAPEGVSVWLAVGIAAAVAAVVAVLVHMFELGTPGQKIGALIGFVLSTWLGSMLIDLIYKGMPAARADALAPVIIYALLIAVIGSGTWFGYRHGRWLKMHNIRAAFNIEEDRKSYKILDTSVIIDGRVADISETGFLGGILVVPQFILKELQQIADSSQSLKRNRGRRGLDILQKIKKMQSTQVIFPEQDFPDVPEVDLKLIELARLLGGKIVTNDFNLNKVAQLRGVDVLNINELANALKPVVLPGEVMQVVIIKEGKEQGQGIGYLDDGTMVVVDNSSQLIGKNIELVVTSVLQTTAGKMIFGKTEDGKASHLAMA